MLLRSGPPSRGLRLGARLPPLRAVPVPLNPQNTPQCKRLPSKNIEVEEAVDIQLAALSDNDTPWPNHGLLTMYEWAEDVGMLERSMYFGFPKDLYHYDHFGGFFASKFPSLMSAASSDIMEVRPEADGTVAVFVRVTAKDGTQDGPFVFVMKRKGVGLKKGCWMTKALVKARNTPL